MNLATIILNGLIINRQNIFSTYLEDGLKIIWVVDPKLERVAEHPPHYPDGVIKRKDDMLSGAEIAQGFELKVSEIFAN